MWLVLVCAVNVVYTHTRRESGVQRKGSEWNQFWFSCSNEVSGGVQVRYKCFVTSCVVVDVKSSDVVGVGVCGKWVVSVLCAYSRECSLCQRCDVLLCLGACLCVRVIASLLA